MPCALFCCKLCFAGTVHPSGLPVAAVIVLAVRVLLIGAPVIIPLPVGIPAVSALTVPAAVTAGGILGAVAVPVPAGLAVPAEQDDQNNLPDEGNEIQEEPRAAAPGRRSRCTFEIRMK